MKKILCTLALISVLVCLASCDFSFLLKLGTTTIPEGTTPAPHIHTEEPITAVEPTCTETGLSQGQKCAICDEILSLEQEVIPALGHNYGSVFVVPTEKEDGYTKHICFNCEDWYITDVITPIDFTVTEDNRAQIGYTGEQGENLIIPAVFESEGTWYRVSTIGNSAFRNCSNLTSVTIPDSVTRIGSAAFSGCNSALYTEYEFGKYVGDSTNPYAVLVGMTTQKRSTYKIHPNTKIVGDGVFYNCEHLTNIAIPNRVRTIGSSAFAFCSNLTSIVVDENNTVYRSINGNLYSKDGTVLIAYARGKTDKTFVIPDAVTTIGDDAFYRCDSLTSVTIGDSVTTIGEYAFGHCSKLTSVTIGDSVTTIGVCAFCGCSLLASVTLGDSVTTIGDAAFADCFLLASVTISDSVTTIGYKAFAECFYLADVYYTGSEAEWSQITIGLYNGKLINATIHYNYIPEE